MTDLSTLHTQNAAPLLDTPVPSSAAASHVPLPSPAVLTNGYSVQEEVDNEEGLIKCICTNPDDDGNTIMCDKCETWQHTSCYYADGKTPGETEPHFCVDCQYRPIDAKAADERQRARLLFAEEPKRVKPGPKAGKKRKSESLSHANSHPNGHGSPRNGAEPPSSKKRPRHQSQSNIPLKIPTKRNPNPPLHSPLKSPHSPNSLPVPSNPDEEFSPEFVQLYKNDSGEDSTTVSQFEDLNVPPLLSDWVRNSEALAQVTNGKSHDDIFVRSKGPLSARRQVVLAKHRKEDRNIVAHGSYPQWIYITVEEDVGKDTFLGELIGKIGFMQTYTQDAANRWEWLRHPLPFVFFHPQLPIVIDTREEGSMFRYLRRSCQPNLTMKTILDDMHDYHFCFTASCDIKAGTELTIPWTVDEHVRRYAMKKEAAGVDEEYISDYVRKVLAEFGGCACNDPMTCTMKRYARYGKDPALKPSKGSKKKHRGVGSRSSSEAIKQAEEEELEDATAASTSSRSKPHTRDNTPSSLVDNKNIMGELFVSEREKRKIEALENRDTSRVKRVKNQQTDKRKVKRKSPDGKQHPSTPGMPKKGSISEEDEDPPHADEPMLGTRINASPSPLQPTGIVAPPRPAYSEAGCQVDFDARSPSPSMSSPTRTFSKRSIGSLHRHVFRKSVLKSETASPDVSAFPSPEADKEKPKETDSTDKLPKIDGISISGSSKSVDNIEKDQEGDVKMSTGQETGLGIQGTSLEADVTVIKALDTAPPETAEDIQPVPNGDGDATSAPQPPTPDVSEKETTDSSPKLQPSKHRPDPDSPPKLTNGNESGKPSKQKDQPRPTLAPHLSREADAAGAPSPSPFRKKRTINLSQYTARRNSSNVSTSDGNGADGGRGDNLSARGSEDPARSLSPLREEIRENGSDGIVLETPNTEHGDPMMTT